MSEVGQGEVPIFPTFRGFRSAVVTEVDTTGTESGGKFSAAFGSAIKGIGVGVAVAVGAVIAGVATVAGKGLERSLNLQDAKAQLTGLGHDAESVGVIMTSALESVKGTAFGLDAAATVAASAVAAGIAPGEALTRTLKLTADAATIAKTPLSEMGAMVNKVAAGGKLTTEVLNQFQDRGVPLLQMVATQYGVTAAAASKMVTDGKVDFASFQNALEKGVGGAALSSGATARGAWANVGAAWGRLGAMFTGSAVDGAPGLFTSIAAAVDRAAAAVKPLSVSFGGVLTPTIAAFSGWIDKIDFGKIVGGIQGIYDLVINGNFSSGLRDAFNVEEDSGIISFVLTVRDGITGLFDLVVHGDFTAAFGRAFNVQEDSDVVGTLLDIRSAIVDFFSAVGQAFQTGDFSGVFALFGAIGTTLQPLAPIFVGVATGIARISGTVGDLIAAGIPVLVPILNTFTDALGFLGDHSEIIAPIIATLAVGFGVYKLAQSAANVASLAAIPIEAARTVAMFASAAATNRNTDAILLAAGADKASLASKLPATGAVLVNTAASIGNGIAQAAMKVAALAGAAATGVATAAQWAFNVALDANPIGIIILAIVALVAGLVWFFTQTELGKAVWTEFTRFLGEAWANISALFTTGIAFISGLWSAQWNLMSTIVTAVWQAISLVVTTYINLIMLVITVILTTISGIWSALWDGFFTVVSIVWTAIQLAISTAFQIVQTIISTVMAVIVAIFTGQWDKIGGIIAGAWSKIQGLIGDLVNGIASAIGQVGSTIGGIRDTIMSILNGAGSWLVDSGKAIIQGFIDGISGMIGAVGDAVGGVMDFVAGFFPHSPARRGPFSGSGWTAVKNAGIAVGDQFGSGLDSSTPSFNARLGALVSASQLTAVVSTSQSTIAANGSSGAPQTLNLYDVDGVLMGAFAVAADARISAADDTAQMVTSGRRRV
ncbi:hypothetical protein E3O55_08505 [Cryobacterium sp. MDB1-18-2]|uniref:tape measure protein n=1 Tax=unclassified Cryobacterium TaxID=2649013 RepID=UPI00106A20E3|nr:MULTISPECIES: tape measure protein [unclassified Cryobacterium]TFC30114.1 hypothetical protein E3O55_08505 [Cryobacterium sp. MDB1-18-2]TFC41394.1 hypothetical protein E3O50_09945 [Cryobacterium sp. MDB1-18-1]